MPLISDNLSGMRSRVRRWLHELTSTTSFWSDSFIDQQVNVAYRRRCAQLVMSFEGYFVNVATRDLVADQERYAWPPGFERLLKVELVRSNGNRSIVMREERHFASHNSNASGGRDSYIPNYRSIGGGLVLEPAPQESVTDGLRIEYTGLPALMEADGDSMHADYPRSFDELVILDAVVACIDSENVLEIGQARTVLRQRQEWEVDFERYIDGRMVSVNKIKPFTPHYQDY